MVSLRKGLLQEMPGLIVTKPEAAIYMVIDFRNICHPGVNAKNFVTYCAAEGAVHLAGRQYTLLLAPMNEFYASQESTVTTQMRIAMVEPQNLIEKTPAILGALYHAYRG